DGARRIAGEDLLSCARVPWPVHDLHERGHLWRREARVGVDPLTQELRWIEVASPRVVDDAVHDAVERVTGGERRGLDGGELARRDVAAWSTHRRLLVPNEPHEVVRPEVGRCPDDDAIVVVGEALRFHERLPAAVRASAEVGTPGTVAVEGADDRLGPLGRFVARAIPEIDGPFRVSQGPAGVAARVAIIRPGGSVAAAEPGGQGAVQDRAREAAIANALELSVPARAWHPDFETDPRGARRRCEARHPAEGRQIVDDLPTRCAEGAGGD